MHLTTDNRSLLINRWLPVLLSGLAAWILFIAAGQTPIIRASGLALIIASVVLLLQRWGSPLAVAGGMALAMCPAFWAQTGGADSLNLQVFALALILAGAAAAVLTLAAHRPVTGIALGIIIFTGIFITTLGTPRSLRLTSLMSVWLLFLLVETLMLTNPRPDEALPTLLRRRYSAGFLVLLGVGIANEPLFALFIPAVALALGLSKSPIPRSFWAALIILAMIGTQGIIVRYLDSGWWLTSAARAEAAGIRVPFVLADGWRVPARWINLFGLANQQFTIVGLVLGLVGLARMSRWYPTLGVVTLTAYATFFLFGLVYFGKDSAVLLMPLYTIQLMWMTYAVYSLGQWVQRIVPSLHPLARWLMPLAFAALPVFLFLKLNGIV